MLATALLSTLSWVGFISAGFVLWSNGNTNGGYSMVGISIILPAVVAVVYQVVQATQGQTVSTGFSPSFVATALLGTLSWLGFIVCGFVLWYYGNTNGGYSMVGIAICLAALLAAILLAVDCRQPVLNNLRPLQVGVALLSTLSWLGFLVAGFMLWYFGNTNGGYSMVGIAISLPAVTAVLHLLVRSCVSSKAPALPSSPVASALAPSGEPAPAPAPAPASAPALAPVTV